VLLFSGEKYELAVAQFQEARDLSPHDGEAALLEGRAHWYAGYHDRALESLIEIERLRIDHDDPRPAFVDEIVNGGELFVAPLVEALDPPVIDRDMYRLSLENLFSNDEAIDRIFRRDIVKMIYKHYRGQHEMALVGFFDSVAFVDEPLTVNAANLRADINGYNPGGYTNIARGLQLGQLELVGGTDPDYMVLLSDGGANRPEDVDDALPFNDFYIDVNDNGIIDAGDDLSVDFPDPDGPTMPTNDPRGIMTSTPRSTGPRPG
jgi:tetratricopeptide (TPR) repeat protein